MVTEEDRRLPSCFFGDGRGVRGDDGSVPCLCPSLLADGWAIVVRESCVEPFHSHSWSKSSRRTRKKRKKPTNAQDKTPERRHQILPMSISTQEKGERHTNIHTHRHGRTFPTRRTLARVAWFGSLSNQSIRCATVAPSSPLRVASDCARLTRAFRVGSVASFRRGGGRATAWSCPAPSAPPPSGPDPAPAPTPATRMCPPPPHHRPCCR